MGKVEATAVIVTAVESVALVDKLDKVLMVVAVTAEGEAYCIADDVWTLDSTQVVNSCEVIG